MKIEIKFKSKWVAIPVIGAVILALLYIPIAHVSESNRACSACHKEQGEIWAHSTHKSEKCRECHVEPGMSGALKAQVGGVKNLAIYVFKGTEIQPHEDPLPISTANCLACHGAILYVNEIGFDDLPDNSLKGQSLLVGHRIHVEEYKIECVECHRGITHRNPDDIGKYETNWPLMHNDCGVCHDGKYWDRFDIEVTDIEDPGKCTVCHPTYIGPGEEGDGYY